MRLFKRRKHKGFTLVELLASITIVAAIILFAIPKMTEVIKNSKKSLNQEKIQGLVKAAKNYYIENGTDVSKFDGQTNVLEYLDFKGDLDEFTDAQVLIDEDGKVAILFKQQGTCFYKDYGMQNVESKNITEGQNCTFKGAPTDEACFVNVPIVGTGTTTITGYKCYDQEITLPVTKEIGLTLRIAPANGTVVTDVIIPDTIGGNKVVAIAENAFAGVNLTSIEMPNTVTSIGQHAFIYNNISKLKLSRNLTTIGSYAFMHNKITSASFGSTLISLGKGAFLDNKITKLVIPSKLTTIPDYAFEYNKIQHLDIPNTVYSVGTYAFAYNDLRDVTLNSTWSLALGDMSLYKNTATSDLSNQNLTTVYNSGIIKYKWFNIFGYDINTLIPAECASGCSYKGVSIVAK